MADHDRSGRESRPEDVAAYVATMARELKGLSEQHKLNELAYLLDLVRLEAEQCAHGAQDDAAHQGDN